MRFFDEAKKINKIRVRLTVLALIPNWEQRTHAFLLFTFYFLLFLKYQLPEKDDSWHEAENLMGPFYAVDGRPKVARRTKSPAQNQQPNSSKP